jgi:endonuclease/exonuclease/phosphatase family metal-dependent hydrolase
VLWEEWAAVAELVQGGMWLTGGDFNCVLIGADRTNDNRDSSATGFQMTVQSLQLCEFPSSRVEFTWRNGNGLASKLDRFFGNVDILVRFQLSSVSGLSRPFSDHTPLVWDSGEENHVGSYFKMKRS